MADKWTREAKWLCCNCGRYFDEEDLTSVDGGWDDAFGHCSVIVDGCPHCYSSEIVEVEAYRWDTDEQLIDLLTDEEDGFGWEQATPDVIEYFNQMLKKKDYVDEDDIRWKRKEIWNSKKSRK